MGSNILQYLPAPVVINLTAATYSSVVKVYFILKFENEINFHDRAL